MSAADQLATDTITRLTFGIVEPEVSRLALALVETAIGVGLISGRFIRLTLLMLFGQMLGTITPLFLFPELTWKSFPLVPTLEGQYIIKNLVLVSAGITIGATVRGGGVLDDPEAYELGRAGARAAPLDHAGSNELDDGGDRPDLHPAGDDDVGVTLGRLDELLVHRPHRCQVLREHRLG